jgi:hypothetical protein
MEWMMMILVTYCVAVGQSWSPRAASGTEVVQSPRISVEAERQPRQDLPEVDFECMEEGQLASPLCWLAEETQICATAVGALPFSLKISAGVVK